VEQRRLVLALGLSLLALFLYQELVLRRYPRRPSPAPLPQAAEAPPPVPAPSVSGLAAPAAERPPITVVTDVARFAITPLGGRLVSLELTRFRQTVQPDSPPLELVKPGPVLPLTLVLDDASDASVPYAADRASLGLHGAESGAVVLAGETGGGVHIEKTYRFRGDGYVFGVEVRLAGPHLPARVGLVLTPVATDTVEAGRFGREVGLVLVNGHLTEKALPDLPKQPLRFDGAAWAGFAAQYFAAVALPPQAVSGEMTAADGTPIVRVEEPLTSGRASFEVFAGPKERDLLMAVGHDLDRALDFGWFWFIAIPLLWALRGLHAITGNYGVAIILLTAVIKLATTPLTRSTFRNMREMQKIQPQMAKLRERYKDDQVALQRELMELYKRHRVNPFSGCLPMLLQLPIFVGLYNTLLHAIELRHAPFVLWINDLSAPDRLMVGGIGIPVLTLLMGASMFVQQWLSPQQGDPTQQRMMMFMPLVFTFMFINFPAGLVLYWLVNNVLTIGQQYGMTRSVKSS
jgi:YidC/Oxa1 family membrane protein insertase